MNVRELLIRLDEIDAAAPKPTIPQDAENLKNLIDKSLTPVKKPGHYEYGMWSDEPATIQSTEYAQYTELQKLINQYLLLVKQRKEMIAVPVKESILVKALVESFGYVYEDEASAATKPHTVKNAAGRYELVTPTGQKIAVGNGFPTQTAAMDYVYKNPQMFTAPEASTMSKLATGVGDVAKSGWKASGGIVGLGIDAAISCWQGYQQISNLPADMPQAEKEDAVRKIIGHLVARFGIRTVGVVMGAAIGGLASGPFALVGAVAGSIIGGLGAEWLAGDNADALADLVIDKLYGKSKVAGQAKWPTSDEEIRAFQKSHKDVDGQPLEVDGMIGNKTLGALKAAGATPPQGFVPVRDKVSSNPNKPNIAAQAEDTTKIDKQIADLKVQIQAILDELSKSKNPEVLKRIEQLKAKLGTDFNSTTTPTATNATVDTTKGPDMSKVNTPASQAGVPDSSTLKVYNKDANGNFHQNDYTEPNKAKPDELAQVKKNAGIPQNNR